MVANNMSNYTSCQDIEDTDNQQFTPGQWRRDTQLYGIQTTSVRNSSKSAKEQRVELTNYFVSENGSVPYGKTIHVQSLKTCIINKPLYKKNMFMDSRCLYHMYFD
jgi:hypothetical protein